MRNFLGAGLIAVGGLVAITAGLCGFVGAFPQSDLTTTIFAPFLIGMAAVIIGVWLLSTGRKKS